MCESSTSVNNYGVFMKLPNPTMIVDLTSELYLILEVNEVFTDMIMPKQRAIKMSFVKDMLPADEMTIFLSALEIMDSLRKHSTNISALKTLTLESKEQFPVFRTCMWDFIKLDDDHGLLTGKLVGYDKAPVLSDRENELVDFFQKAPISLHWLSGTGDVIWANDNELNTLGYTAEEYIGHSILEFCPEEKESVVHVFAELAAGRTVHNAPFKFRTKSGEARYLTVDSNVSFHEDGTFKHTRCFIRDDTERRIREAIQETRMKDMLCHIIAKDRFIRRVFHEIRTPMHTVSSCLNGGAVASFAKEELDELSHQTEACLGLIEDLAFATMIEAGNLLRLRPYDIDIASTIHNIIEQVKVSAVMNNHSSMMSNKISVMIDKSVPSIIHVDRCLNRALFNLINNAACVSDHNGSVIIELSSSSVSSYEHHHNLSCTIRASLSSPFDIIDVHKSFHSYYNADIMAADAIVNNTAIANLTDSLSSALNLGLGWFVAYNIISNLGGELKCEVDLLRNEVKLSFDIIYDHDHHVNMDIMPVDDMIRVDNMSDDGLITPSTPLGDITPHHDNGNVMMNHDMISSTVPMADSELAAQHIIQDVFNIIVEQDNSICQPPPSKRHRAMKRILVVDDSPICQKVLVKSLTADNYDTDTASNGQEACDKLAHEPCLYDAVLMDLRMPIMDGITATRICKEKAHLKNIPIIIVTAELGDEVRAAAYEANATCFISKPAKAHELKEVLHRILNL